MLTKSILQSSFLLGAFALLTVGVLSATYMSTKSSIAEVEREAASKALLEIVPLDRHSNDMLVDRVPLPEQYWETLGLSKGGDIHFARKEGKVVAIIVPAEAQDGYSGGISMIIGINFDGTLAGVRVLRHTETPGLGDRVDLRKSDWILSFNGKSLGNPHRKYWKVKKDQGEFDQFTGATITPRAVVRQVYKALQFFDGYKAQLLHSEVALPSSEKLPQSSIVLKTVDGHESSY